MAERSQLLEVCVPECHFPGTGYNRLHSWSHWYSICYSPNTYLGMALWPPIHALGHYGCFDEAGTVVVHFRCWKYPPPTSIFVSTSLWVWAFILLFLHHFSSFCYKSCEKMPKGDSDQSLECRALKCCSKYTTPDSPKLKHPTLKLGFTPWLA